MYMVDKGEAGQHMYTHYCIFTTQAFAGGQKYSHSRWASEMFSTELSAIKNDCGSLQFQTGPGPTFHFLPASYPAPANSLSDLKNEVSIFDLLIMCDCVVINGEGITIDSYRHN